MSSTPHYLRVARALALVTGLAGVGCGSSHSADAGRDSMDSGPDPIDSGPDDVDAGPLFTDAGPPGVDAGPPGVDAGPPGVDAGGPVDAGNRCDSCECLFGVADAGERPSCDSLGYFECCAIVGPMFPPNVPA